MKNYFILYANCLLVKGHTRTLIHDLNTGTLSAIPNELGAYFQDSKILDLKKETAKLESEEQQKILLEYIDYLNELEVGFYSDLHLSGFDTQMNLTFYHPFALTNIIVDLREFDAEKMKSIITQVEELSIRNVEMRLLSEAFEQEDLTFAYDLVKETHISSFSVIAPHSLYAKSDKDTFVNFRLTKAIIYGSDTDEVEEHKGTDLIFTTKQNISEKSCGVVSEKYFTLNIPTFTEVSQT